MESEVPVYDFIVVGAGPAGCVVASRLANSKSRPLVLLVEAGGDNSDVNLRVSGNKYVQFMTPSQSFSYSSVPQENLAGRAINMARGKGLGGSTAVNFTAWTVGPRDDMDEMARLTGDDAWKWENALARWRGIENYHALPGARTRTGSDGKVEMEMEPPQRLPARAAKYLRPVPAAHGTDGPLHISFPEKWDAEPTDMADAWEANGYALNPDLGDDAFLGVSMVPNTEYRGARATAADLLHPTPDNLHIVTNAPVHRVLFSDDGRAVGIKLLSPDGSSSSTTAAGAPGRQYTASKEVVICAGTMDSPKLLLHSGIGPAPQLARFGLPLVHDSPGVGQNYMDHYHVILQFQRSESASVRPSFFRDPARRRAAMREWELHRSGDYATLGAQMSMGFFKSPAVLSSDEFAALPVAERARLERPTIPSYEVCFNVTAPGYYVAPDTTPAVAAIFLFLLNSQGRGEFVLQSGDPTVPLAFSPDFLRHPYDRRVAVEATREVMRVVRSESFASRTVRHLVVPASDEEEDILAFWRDQCSSTWHMVGTVKMGRGEEEEEDGSVVDTEFRVRGVKGLRVADMSIMPIIPSCHTQSTAYQIGMIAAEKLIREYSLEPEV